MTGYVPVDGTHAAKRKDWDRADSLFDQYLRRRGFARTCRAFGFWPTAIGGPLICSGHLGWQFGGRELRQFLAGLPFKDRIVIAHSHGGQVAAYALAAKPVIPVRALVTIGTPCRKDMDDVWAEVRQSVKCHIHLYGTGWGARVRWIGQRFRFKREMPTARENHAITGGHSGILRKAQHMGQIDAVLARIRAADTT